MVEVVIVVLLLNSLCRVYLDPIVPCLFSGIDLCDVGKEIQDSPRVAPFIVIPGDKLDEVVVESDTCLDIEDRGVGVAIQVSGDDVVVVDSQDAYTQISLLSRFDLWSSAYLLARPWKLSQARQRSHHRSLTSRGRK